MSDLLKRPGRVTVEREVLEQNADTLQEILGQILIVEARPRFIQNDIEYTGFSYHFEEQEDGNNIPMYTIDVTMDGDDMSVEFKKEED